jgi:hypothetical protein
MKHFILLLFAFVLLFSACKKDDTTNGNSSRVLKYGISGNYSGSLVVSYTTASGSTANETITVLPWNKEVTYASNVTAAIIAISGNGGTAGQQVTVVVKRGDSKVSSTTATANSYGSFTKAAPAVTF